MALPKAFKYQIDLLANNQSAGALNKFKKDIGGVSSVVTQLGQTLAAAFSVRELVEAANVMIGVENRMNALTGSAEETANAMSHMRRIASDSRSDFDAVAMLYTRLSLATEHLGATQRDVADATQTVANTFIIAGSHAQEANNSARQLAQGLASGALRGDELRSVMENNTILTKMLADGLNMTIGELREFGHAGKLTAETVMPILIKGTRQTNEEIMKMPMTLGQAGVALKNNFQFMIGDVQKTTQGFSKIADMVKFVAVNLDALLIPAIFGVTVAVKGLTVAILANPLGLLLAGFTALVMAAYVFRQEIYNDFKEVFDVTIPNFIDKGLITLETFKQSMRGLVSLTAIKAIKKGLNNVIEIFNSAIDKMPNLAHSLGFEKMELFDISTIQEDVNSSVAKIAEIKKRIRDRVVSDDDYEVPSILEFIFGKPEDQNGDDGTGFKQLTKLEQFLISAENGYKDFFTNIKTMQEEMQGVFKKSYDGLTQLTMDFLEKGKASFKDYATSIVRELIRIAVQKLIIDKMFASIGTSFRNIKGSMEYDKLTDNDTLFDRDYDGGGYTGMGARAGGMDGKGGFPAMLHPNETVVDHTKGQSMGGATVNFNISTVDAAGFDQLLASRKGMITAIINQAMNSRGKMGVV
jgi:tape measure domain-containing protein